MSSRADLSEVGMSTAFQNIQVAGGDTSKPLAMAKRLNLIERHLRGPGGRFLDCGCGCGDYVLALMKRLQLDAHGIELDNDKLNRAWSNVALQGRVVRGDLQAIDCAACTWDYAMLNEVLEHVPDDGRALKEVYRILKPGGIVFIFSPNRWFPFETHGVRLKRSDRRVPHWIPFIPYVPLAVGKLWFHYWARNYWQGELAALVRSSGFAVIERAFVWVTFEDISGHQPEFIRKSRPLLRFISDNLEGLPIVKRFGVSQVLVCTK